MNKELYIGIDVQVRRECAYAAVDGAGTMLDSGWFPDAASGLELFKPFANEYKIYFGIDACRMPLKKRREFYWNGSTKTWRQRRTSDKGLGRHCEVVIKAHNLANPQWTPLKDDAPDWMRLGFELFSAFGLIGTTFEAFPSASYSLIENDPSVQLNVNFSNIRKGCAKDMLDAWVVAATVREFVQGRGAEVGGGDRLGSIILPRPLKGPIDAVLAWPE